MSLLSIIQEAADLLGIPRPSAVVSSSDQQVRQLFALANEEGAELAAKPVQGWQALTREYTFVTVADEAQVNALPADFGFVIPDTVFNRTSARKLIGPITAEKWQAIHALGSYAAPDGLFRIRGGEILITPVPPAGETVAYEYSSSYWAKSSAGVRKLEFTADEDETYLPESLVVQGLRWRFKQAKGLDYAEDMATYERNLQRIVGRDGGSSALNIGGGDRRFLANIPQTIPIS